MSIGPFDREQDARAAALAMVPPRDGWSILWTAENRQLLGDACRAAGVELGAYDATVIECLAGFEDAMCGSIAGLILRAAASQHDSESEGR